MRKRSVTLMEIEKYFNINAHYYKFEVEIIKKLNFILKYKNKSSFNIKTRSTYTMLTNKCTAVEYKFDYCVMKPMIRYFFV